VLFFRSRSWSGFTNEAAFYLTFLPDSYEKYIVMLKSHHPKRNESPAEYYFRINHHLLGKIKVAKKQVLPEG